MFEALRLQIPNAILFRNLNCAGLIGNFADTRNLDAVNSLWQTHHVIRAHRKQQLEIFPAMQCQRQRVKRTTATKFAYIFIDGNLR